MFTETPIKEVRLIHYGKVLARVMTANHENDKGNEKLKEFFKSGILQHAGIQLMEVQTTGPNEAKTALKVEGLLQDKNGILLYPEEPKRNVINVEIPFNQSHVNTQPGTWFDGQKRAQEYAAILNKGTKDTVAILHALLDKVDAYQDDVIAKGA